MPKLACNVFDKKNYVVHTKTLKLALDYGLVLEKVHRVIEFNQEAWLNSYIETNIKLRKKTKNDFEKNFFKLLNNSVFSKTMNNVRNHREINLVMTDKRKNRFTSETNCNTAKKFSEKLIAIEMNKTNIKMNKTSLSGSVDSIHKQDIHV